MLSTLVVGSGYTGSRILKRHPAATALSRSTGFDLDGEVQLPEALPDAYQVIYTVPPARAEHDPRLARCLELMQPLPMRFVYLSTTGVYGDCHGALVDETSPLHPTSDRARRRVDAEARLSQWVQDSDCELTVLRVPGIYGPGRLGEQRIKEKQVVLVEEDANPGNRIHVDDLVSCCLAALDNPAGIYNVGDGDQRSSTWFAFEVARQLGLPAPPGISRAEAAATFSPRRLSFLHDARRINTRKMREQLGVTPRYEDAADGIAASL